MKRLTKNENGTYLLNVKLNKDGFPIARKHAEKLGKLEDVEENLCIPLDVLAQLEYRYLWFKDQESGELMQASPERVSISLYKKDLSVDAGPKGTYFLYFKDYGKTWAFERDELVSIDPVLENNSWETIKTVNALEHWSVGDTKTDVGTDGKTRTFRLVERPFK